MCPCSRHKNTIFLSVDEVKLDLYRKGFQPNYWYWTCYVEFEPHIDVEAGTSTRNVSVPTRYEYGGQYKEFTEQYVDRS